MPKELDRKHFFKYFKGQPLITSQDIWLPWTVGIFEDGNILPAQCAT